MSAEFHEPGSEEQSFSLGTVLFGLILLFLGSLWLLDVIDIIDVTWTLVGSGVLILIGLLLLTIGRNDEHGGMIFLGVVLSVIVLLGSVANWPSIHGGVGERVLEPESFGEVELTYNWSLGSQTVDFREVEFPTGSTEISIQHGTGNLEVYLPADTGFQVEWSVGVGNADVFEEIHTGVSLSGIDRTDDYEAHDRQVTLKIQLGIGSLEVRQ